MFSKGCWRKLGRNYVWNRYKLRFLLFSTLNLYVIACIHYKTCFLQYNGLFQSAPVEHLSILQPSGKKVWSLYISIYLFFCAHPYPFQHFQKATGNFYFNFFFLIPLMFVRFMKSAEEFLKRSKDPFRKNILFHFRFNEKTKLNFL